MANIKIINSKFKQPMAKSNLKSLRNIVRFIVLGKYLRLSKHNIFIVLNIML